MTTPTFPFTLPGLDVVSSEWVTFSLLWLAIGTVTAVRFFGMVSGSLTARLATAPAGMAVGLPGLIAVFAGILGHFAVIASILAEVLAEDSPLIELKQQLEAVLATLGGAVEALLPPLAAIGRLHWDYLVLAAVLVATSELLLRPALATANRASSVRQSQVLQAIAKKSSEKGKS